MTLREQIRHILETRNILPDHPDHALSGTELLERIRPMVVGSYTETSFPPTFSILAKDPTSPIARREGRFGYYRLPAVQQATKIEDDAVQSAESDVAPLQEGGARNDQLEEKFRAFFIRYATLDNRFPVHIEHVIAQRQRAGVNKWKFPDVVVLDWMAGESGDSGFFLDSAVLDVRRGLGEQPFLLTSVELKVDLSFSTFREFFFQCVSNSKWAHSAALVVACPVSDALLSKELRRLGTSYGVAISTFDFSRDELASLPSADELMKMTEEEFEKIAEQRKDNTLTAGTVRPGLDWDHLQDLKTQSTAFSEIFGWIARCLRDSKPYTMRNYQELTRIEGRPG